MDGKWVEIGPQLNDVPLMQLDLLARDSGAKLVLIFFFSKTLPKPSCSSWLFLPRPWRLLLASRVEASLLVFSIVKHRKI
jgi:hypothetical protein